ncbi:gamma-glutamyl-gamma-aminobutyrate hydrolase family protein [Planomonospora venezuelensis]|uniref:Gamma-glutamyl-gamma-aminobutyrate hydrolase PuuD n=1 Tax=Planomonospora venezuelensis TaxID=1999 RepID=A0A841DE21_PLAVE|nr:gamma-glutamyl-gamma-aminobutyrate hydrolase family protein [Planomonospora venezuelensis]MBB5967023.1 gamma-glutamyl-gamma-aminobutyrate hydrolase PuuD [Planomonospora venezuelensis]GIN01508.1 gamma-glutamyl-gamma-aminobutyrate hydrolase [Planomonospora venezuelensis]
MSRPLIGITSYLEAARWGTWVREAVLSPPAYARAVEKAGGAPVLLPPLTLAAVDDYVGGLSGLILAGGSELDPGLYGAARDERAEEPQPHRDRFELALARAAVAADLPLLAVARGMHVLNVAQGGSLIPSLPDVVDHDRHGEGGRVHTIQISVSSKLGKAIGDRAEVAAPHRQAVKRLGTGLLAVAWADDQIVEGIELQGHRFGVGVQWHPERDTDNRLVEALVEAAVH